MREGNKRCVLGFHSRLARLGLKRGKSHLPLGQKGNDDRDTQSRGKRGTWPDGRLGQEEEEKERLAAGHGVELQRKERPADFSTSFDNFTVDLFGGDIARVELYLCKQTGHIPA